MEEENKNQRSRSDSADETVVESAGNDGLIGRMVVELADRQEHHPWKTKTIKLGLLRPDAYRTAIRCCGCEISDWANDIMLHKMQINKPAFTAVAEKQSVDVELELVTVAELGFVHSAKLHNIYARAQSMGLELCSAEVGPALRLAYLDQQPNEWLWIGMDPIIATFGGQRVFGVGCCGGDRWLGTNWGNSDSIWHGCRRWVFVRRK